MSSINLGEVRDVETAVETAFAAGIQAALPDVAVNVTEDLDELPVPRVDLVAQKTGEGPHEVQVGGTWYYDQWTVQLAIRLVTSPDDEKSADTRRTLEAAIIDGIQSAPDGEITFSMPLHHLADFKLSPSTRSILEEEKCVGTEWTLDLMLFAKPSAW
jgi:hypothetical protein